MSQRSNQATLFIVVLSVCVLGYTISQFYVRSIRATSTSLTKIDTTFLDKRGQPIEGATALVYDSTHHILDNPNLLVMYSDHTGQMSECVPTRNNYYIRSSAVGFLSKEVMVTPESHTAHVTFILQESPQTQHITTTFSARIINTEGKPIAGGGISIFDKLGNNMTDLKSGSSFSDVNGKIEMTVKTGGTYTIQASAAEYLPSEVKIASKPGSVPFTLVLQHENEEVVSEQQRNYVQKKQRELDKRVLSNRH